MKSFFFLQSMVLILSVPAFSATYMMVAPDEMDLQVPSQAILWQEKMKKKENVEADFNCDEQEAKLSTIHADYSFVDAESCEKVQMMLRLATPQCPLQLDVNTKTKKINSYQLECDNLKL